MSDLNKLLQGTAGQNFGAGGDYITPGTHCLRVDEQLFFESSEDKTPTFIVKGTVVTSQPGLHKFEMVNGKGQPCSPKTCAAMRPGQTFVWIMKSSSLVFSTRVGNFNAAVKHAFIDDLNAAQAAGKLDEYIASKWAVPDRIRVRNFYTNGIGNPDETIGNDPVDINECKLSHGLFLQVNASEGLNKKQTVILTNTVWSAVPVERLRKLEEIAGQLDAGTYGED